MTTTPQTRPPAEATYRLLLTLFPKAWRQRHGQEALSILVDRAVTDRYGRTGVADSIDLVWHAVVARLAGVGQPVLGRLPRKVRAMPGLVIVSLGTVFAVIMLIGEIAGAHHRPASPNYSLMFLSGPVLTIGVGIDIGFIATLMFVLAGRTQLARMTSLGTSILALWMTWPNGLLPYPKPPTVVTGTMAVLALIALLGLVHEEKPSRRQRVITGAAALVATAGLILLLFMITGSIGWVPAQPHATILAAITTYAAIGIPVIVATAAFVHAGIRQRDIGAVLLLALVIQAATTLSAIAQAVESEPPSAWLWPAACLILALAIARYLRHRLTVADAQRTPPDPTGPVAATSPSQSSQESG